MTGTGKLRTILVCFFCWCLQTLLSKHPRWDCLPQNQVISLVSIAVIHSWNLFLLITSIPSLLGGVLFYFLPESPKFLMSRGRNIEALAVFQDMYFRNRNSGEYPIKVLANEKYNIATHNNNTDCERKTGAMEAPMDVRKHRALSTVIKDGLEQMSLIFVQPNLRNCALVFTMQFGFLWSQNTMRLWLPSILALITGQDTLTKESNTTFDLCQVIASSLREPPSSSPYDVSLSPLDTAATGCSQVTHFSSLSLLVSVYWFICCLGRGWDHLPEYHSSGCRGPNGICSGRIHHGLCQPPTLDL